MPQKWWSTPRQCNRTSGKPEPRRFSEMASVSSFVMGIKSAENQDRLKDSGLSFLDQKISFLR